MLKFREYGAVKEIVNCIARVAGMFACINGQRVYFADGSIGMVMGFDANDVMVLLLKEAKGVKTGDKAYTIVETMEVPVGDEMLGRVVNTLGEAVDGKGPLLCSKSRPIFADAASVLERVPIKEPLETGIKIIDTMIPLGKGQRQLIIGDRITGKTTIATDVILNQKGKNVVCIYCCIGKSGSSLTRVLKLFERRGTMEYSIVVSATASSTPGQQYLAPYVACSIGEHFMYNGRDVLVVFDDLTKHAWIYRQISLLMKRFPGRNAYPGDIFYLHSQMIERAGRLCDELDGGSMSFLPIVDTLQGDVTGYVPSNLISMTDGQIYLSAELFSEGFKPAIDLGLSVSRIGSKAQWPAIRNLGTALRLEYVRYKDMENLTKIKTGISDEVVEKLRIGRILTELLKQDKDQPVAMEEQAILLYLHSIGRLDKLTIEEARNLKFKIGKVIADHDPELLADVAHRKAFTPEIVKRMEGIVV